MAYAAIEEIVFRGYVMKTIEKHIGVALAVIINSIIFSLSHIWNYNVTILGLFHIFLFGIILSILCIHRNNLWLPIGIHTGWNYALYCFNLPISGYRWYNPILNTANIHKSNWTGSSFGPEDSLVVLILLLIVLGFIGKNSNRLRGFNNLE